MNATPGERPAGRFRAQRVSAHGGATLLIKFSGRQFPVPPGPLGKLIVDEHECAEQSRLNAHAERGDFFKIDELCDGVPDMGGKDRPRLVDDNRADETRSFDCPDEAGSLNV
jgi:hypothetical protein